jgi:acyl-CoA synthetase (AMP-forming)/AMP-acid ligase II
MDTVDRSASHYKRVEQPVTNMPVNKPANLPFASPVDMIQRHAQAMPDRLVFLFLEQGEIEAERLTFAELERSARQIAAHLQSICEPGERALLILPTGLDFVKAISAACSPGLSPSPPTHPA